MKIGYMSDLHGEFWGPFETPDVSSLTVGEDVLVLAGDVGTLNGSLERYLEHYAATGLDIIYVTGNHEHYSLNSHERLADLCRQLSKSHPGFHRLENETIEIRGQRFAGTTLWFGDVDKQNQMWESMMPDFRAIKIPGERTAEWIYKRNDEAKKFLFRCQADVVVTHHLPSQEVVHPYWKKSNLNRFFVSEVAHLVQPAPKHWIFGHTHSRGYRHVNGIEYHINPRGYPKEVMTNYDSSAVMPYKMEVFNL